MKIILVDNQSCLYLRSVFVFALFLSLGCTKKKMLYSAVLPGWFAGGIIDVGPIIRRVIYLTCLQLTQTHNMNKMCDQYTTQIVIGSGRLGLFWNLGTSMVDYEYFRVRSAHWKGSDFSPTICDVSYRVSVKTS